MRNSASPFWQVATVALIIIATRWLMRAKGAQLPRTRNGTSVYSIKWQWRAVGLAGVIFSIIVSIESWHDLHRPDWGMIAISVVFVTIGLWMASGSVRTNRTGITKKVLWHSRSLRWNEITEVLLRKKDIGAIELRAGSRKLIIESRFNAFQHLLNEIKDQTKLEPSGKVS
jgi:hypothetical protein